MINGRRRQICQNLNVPNEKEIVFFFRQTETENTEKNIIISFKSYTFEEQNKMSAFFSWLHEFLQIFSSCFFLFFEFFNEHF